MFVLWASAVRYLGLVRDPKFLYTQYLHTVANKATGAVCNSFPFPVRDSTLTQSLLFGYILTYAAPGLPTASTPSYPVKVSPSHRNHPRSTSTSHLHDTVNIEPAHPSYHPPTYSLIFGRCPSPLRAQQIGNYTVADLTTIYKKYKQMTETYSAVITSPIVTVFL